MAAENPGKARLPGARMRLVGLPRALRRLAWLLGAGEEPRMAAWGAHTPSMPASRACAKPGYLALALASHGYVALVPSKARLPGAPSLSPHLAGQGCLARLARMLGTSPRTAAWPAQVPRMPAEVPRTAASGCRDRDTGPRVYD
jgi:hypothetical protein